jgi:hypothetical protein
MREGSNQFSHRADPARMGEIGLELFGTFAVFNVRLVAVPLADLASPIQQRRLETLPRTDYRTIRT